MTGIVLALVSAPSFAEQATTRPKIVFDSIVKRCGSQKTAQLFVKNSEPVGPGAHAISSRAMIRPMALVVDAVVEAARWKIKEFQHAELSRRWICHDDPLAGTVGRLPVERLSSSVRSRF